MIFPVAVVKQVRTRTLSSPTFSSFLLPTSHSALCCLTTMLFSRNLFAALLVVTAIGVAGSSVERKKRGQLGNVYMCDGGGFTEVAQPCQLLSIDSDVCNLLPAVFNGTIASFGPDSGVGCTLYS